MSGTGDYTLLFRPGHGDVGQENCPAQIRGQTHIGGLSLIPLADLNVAQFRYLEDPKKLAPTTEPTAGMAIRSEYDGVGTEFYCHDGKWLYRRFH